MSRDPECDHEPSPIYYICLILLALDFGTIILIYMYRIYCTTVVLQYMYILDVLMRCQDCVIKFLCFAFSLVHYMNTVIPGRFLYFIKMHYMHACIKLRFLNEPVCSDAKSCKIIKLICVDFFSKIVTGEFLPFVFVS